MKIFSMQLTSLVITLGLIFILLFGWMYVRPKRQLKKLQLKASAKDPQAQYQLGLLYYHGKKLTKDVHRAFTLFESAAQQGHVQAQLALAGLYNAGIGVEKNEANTLYWYKQAAQQGDFEARINLAICYLQGIGTNQDAQQGIDLLQAAADEKSPLACTLLAQLYETGRHVEKNENLATKYYILAAKQGEPIATQWLKDHKK